MNGVPERPRSRALARLRKKHDPLTSLVLTVPVFVTYHIGVLFLDLRNGADLVTDAVLRLLSFSLPAYVGFTSLVATLLLIAGLALRKKGHVDPLAFGPVLLESTLLALIMLLTVGWATEQIFSWQIGPRTLGPFEKVVMAAGAGFHEEVVFRVALFGGLTLLLEKWGRGPKTAVAIAAIISSVAFAAIHYLGPLADTLSLASFVFRTFSGLYLALIYGLRGFAVVVYTHAIYDLFVFFVF